jgi:hypothetical protein
MTPIIFSGRILGVKMPVRLISFIVNMFIYLGCDVRCLKSASVILMAVSSKSDVDQYSPADKGYLGWPNQFRLNIKIHCYALSTTRCH